jgi:hypothetical protein
MKFNIQLPSFRTHSDLFSTNPIFLYYTDKSNKVNLTRAIATPLIPFELVSLLHGYVKRGQYL